MECPSGFWCRDWLNIAILVVTAIAIVVGPVVAVRLSLRFEESREKLRRKYQTFHALMRTRRVTLSPDHVTGLNVIQTEFHDDDKVVTASKNTSTISQACHCSPDQRRMRSSGLSMTAMIHSTR
jgi:hypothetical protein